MTGTLCVSIVWEHAAAAFAIAVGCTNRHFVAVVEGWSSVQPRGTTRLEPPLAAILCPGTRWQPKEKPLPPEQKQIAALLDTAYVCAAAVNNISLISVAPSAISVRKEMFEREEVEM